MKRGRSAAVHCENIGAVSVVLGCLRACVSEGCNPSKFPAQSGVSAGCPVNKNSLSPFLSLRQSFLEDIL